MTNNAIAALVLLVLQIIDAWTTVYALSTVKNAVEKNPILKALFDVVGVVPGLIIIKGTLAVLIVILHEQLHIGVLLLLVVVYIWVVFNNLRLLKK